MSSFELVIRSRKGWQPIDVREIVLYRELLVFLIWRDIKIRYRQTLLGGLWAVLQPLVAMVIFTFVFNRLAGVNSGGSPYPLFAFAGLVPWIFFSTAVQQSSNSLLANQQLVSKVYFPRIFIPLGAIGALLLDLLLSLTLLGLLMLYYHRPVSANIVWLPAFIIAVTLAAAGVGLVLSALNVSFRDVKYMVPFAIQMGLFVTPVIYPLQYIPQSWQPLMGLNPVAGAVLGFRYAILGDPVSRTVVGVSVATSLALFVFGLLLFRRMESRFADVI
ncbi:MAG: Transport permease protein [Gammaproteobacteria bacterium]|nr:Transport permease protein [Gammaproteobacteria bacterium]